EINPSYPDVSSYPTRRSSDLQGVVDYYARRAANDVGLIITEGSYIGHPSAASYEHVPHFHGEEALAGWARVRRAVHEAGGKIFRSEEHTSELQSRENLVCRLL